MFEEIISLANLFSAWYEYRRGKRSKPDVRAFERRLEDNLFLTREELATGAYRHGSYERRYIFDPKPRVIHVAAVRDRVIHRAVYRVIAPLFEQSFIHDSYSCRKERGTHAAVRRLETFVRRVSRNYTRPCWALKCDIRKFFDSVDHPILLNLLGRKISDGKTMRLVAEIVGSYGGGGSYKEFRSEI